MKRLLLLVPLLYLSEAYPMAQTPPSLSPDQTAVAEGNNAFAVDLYGQLRKQDGNLFFSPESISTAFAMAYAGARGTTAPQMATALHFTLPPDRLHPAMGALLTASMPRIPATSFMLPMLCGRRRTRPSSMTSSS
jgi:hypothetical protein